MVFFLISLLFLGISLHIKKNINKDINYYMLLSWTVILFVDFVFFLITKETNMNFKGMLICCMLSILTVIFSKKNKGYKIEKTYVNSYLFFFICFFFLIASIVMIKKYINLFVMFNGNGTDILLNKELLLESGFVSYSFMLGISISLLIPYININGFLKNIITIIVLLAYMIYPKRSYFIITIFILILNKYYSNYEKIHNEVRKVNKKNILLIVIIGMIGFHYTQVIFNKSIYNNEYMNTVGKYTEIQTIFLDTAIYTNGNISNSDKYIDYSKENTEKPILNNTLHAFYSFTKNFGFPKKSIDIDNVFIKTGDFSTNTINMFAYYYADLNFFFMIFSQCFIIGIFNIFSNRKSTFTQIMYPLILYIAVMSFRENNFMFIYFYITCFVEYISSIKFKLTNIKTYRR